MNKCDRCKKKSATLIALEREDETVMLCPRCWGYEDARSDFEYERQKEEGAYGD